MWSTSKFNFRTSSIFNFFLMILKDSLKFSKSMQFADDTIIYYSGKSVTNIKEILTRWLTADDEYFVMIRRIYRYQFK